MIEPDEGVVTAGVVIGDVPTPATSTLRVCAAMDTVPAAGVGLVLEGVVVPVDVVDELLPDGFVVGVVPEVDEVLEGGGVVEVEDVLDVDDVPDVVGVGFGVGEALEGGGVADVDDVLDVVDVLDGVVVL